MQETNDDKRCVVCGGPLPPLATKCCSPECRKKRESERVRQKNLRRKQQRICPNCGKSFVSDLDHRKYCSEQCAEEGRKAMKQQKPQDRPFEEVTPKLIIGLHDSAIKEDGLSHKEAVHRVASDLDRSVKIVAEVVQNRKFYGK